jgi:hypothetical protein
MIAIFSPAEPRFAHNLPHALRVEACVAQSPSTFNNARDIALLSWGNVCRFSSRRCEVWVGVYGKGAADRRSYLVDAISQIVNAISQIVDALGYALEALGYDVVSPRHHLP